MISLQDVMKAVDQLSPEERTQLRAYLDQHERPQRQLDPEQMPAEEWIQRMEAAAAAIREGFTDEEWAEIERDMNAEYIEPWDESKTTQRCDCQRRR